MHRTDGKRRTRHVTTSVNSSVGSDFGPNEWLVHEIWQQYQQDPNSVSPEWREFLSDYRPVDGGATTPSGRRVETVESDEGSESDDDRDSADGRDSADDRDSADGRDSGDGKRSGGKGSGERSS